MPGSFRLLASATLAAAILLALRPSDEDRGPDASSASVDFVQDVRPILSDRCFICHGPDAEARESDLRLDSFAGATEDLGGYAAIVPGDPGASELLRRVRHERERRRMPPAASKLTLSDAEIATLERWIADGAEYERHWAFVPPERPPVPEVEASSWPREELDGFVLARLEAEGLEPSPEASRETWLRRVSFDLTGLPPTLEELDDFLADTSATAYERVVDRLLASPRYGERMASDWLDAARYADSYGYQNDVARDVWPWRDWVIEAFNQDLGWDAFAIWQLAGDLLPEPTREQRLATTFNRLHRQTNEGGSVEEEYRIESVSDRVHTFGTAFLGLTLECARCHDHKYDPILQSEYYGVSAFFDNIDEAGLYSHFTDAVPTPTLVLSTEEDERQLALLDAAVQDAERALDQAMTEASRTEDLGGDREGRAHPAAGADRSGDREGSSGADDGADDGASGVAPEIRWPASGWPDAPPGCVVAIDFESIDGDALTNDADPDHPGELGGEPSLVEGRHGQGLELDGDDNAHVPGVGAFSRDDPFTVALWVHVPEAKQRAVVLHHSRAWTDSGSRGYELLIEEGALSAALIHFWPGNALRVRAVDPLPLDRWVHVAMTYDGGSRAAGLSIHVDGLRAETRTVRDALTRTISGGDHTLTLGQRFRDIGLAGGRVDELRVYDRQLVDAEVRHLATGEPLPSLLASSADDALAFRLAVDEADVNARRAELHAARRALSAYRDGLPEIMTMVELDAPRPTHRLARGSYLEPAERVQPGTPEQVASFGADLAPDRLGLSQWLVAPENPLFARVSANRFWRLAFGEGLVPTAENFGSQGVPPTQPELLDHLSHELRASGWSVKSMMRRLVLSATYRQTSHHRVAAEGGTTHFVGAEDGQADQHAADAPHDPFELFARGPRRRLTAEMLRDQALFVSGLLVEQLGGPPVKPYQPPGLWQEKSGVVYTADEGSGLWRRSLYTFWKRTSPPPSMMIFDAAKRDVCVARRQQTSSPLQALALWNDPQQVEAARALGERLMLEVPTGDAERVAHAFRLVTSRRPDPEELAVLTDLLADARAAYEAAPEDAEALIAVGHSTADAELDPVELAALTVVANTLLSSDGAVTLR
jgi:mono/diheme cytochrome c family protein